MGLVRFTTLSCTMPTPRCSAPAFQCKDQCALCLLSQCSTAGVAGRVFPPCSTVPGQSRLLGCRVAHAALGGGIGSRRLLNSPGGRRPWCLGSTLASPPDPPPHSPPAALAGRCDLPMLFPRRHGQRHQSRAGRARTGLRNCCDTDKSRHVLAWAPLSAR